MKEEKEFKLMKADDIKGKAVAYKKDCMTQDKKEVNMFKTNNKFGTYSCDMDTWLEFLGTFIARGTTENNLIKIKWNSRFAQRITEISEQMKLTFEKESDLVSMNSTYIVKNNVLYEYLKNSYNLIPAFAWELSMRQTRLLLDSLVAFDSFGKGEKYYYTKNEKQADEVMRLALHAGISANIDKVIVNKNDKNSKIPMIKVTILYDIANNQPIVNDGKVEDKVIKFKGDLYCVEVPSHVFYVRSRTITGSCKGVWTGNCSRHAQKGTVGITYKTKDMPMTKDGITPDIIMNPHAVPSRMTIGQMIECIAGKKGVLKGHEVDGTPFNKYDYKQFTLTKEEIDNANKLLTKEEQVTITNPNSKGMEGLQRAKALGQALKDMGYNEWGYEHLYCGITGKKMQCAIFIGPTYYQRLKHLVADKIHSRARGPKQLLTRQPPEGRSRDGGLRIGEMERDVIIAHGMSSFLKEKLMETSDAYMVHVCDKCGLFAQKVLDKNVYHCPACNNTTEISKVNIPYAFKLMIQELMSMGIASRIRTKKDMYNESLVSV